MAVTPALAEADYKILGMINANTKRMNITSIIKPINLKKYFIGLSSHNLTTIPRALALCTTGLESYTFALGLGKWITSVTMTVFYVLLYYVWRRRYQIAGKRGLTVAMYVLAAARVVLCMMPQNRWLTGGAPLAWGIYRNIPFALIGLLVIVLFFRSAKVHDDRAFRWMWLTIVLSFGFYIPVVLWADAVPMIGMLMIPKTCAYVWTVLIGYKAMKKECGSAR